MASTTRRLSRKELRQPDWFQATTENALAWFERHRLPVYLGIGAIILLFLGIWGWRAFKEHQDSSAAQEFTQALIQYHAGKHPEAIAGFEKVQSYRWSKYSNLAHLYEANSYLALNELAKAASAAQRFISGTSQNSLMRQIGLVTLAAIEERKSKCNDAIKHYAEASKIKAAFTDRALFNQARCAVQMNDIQAAIAAYRQLLKDQPKSAIASYVTFRIGELESSWPLSQRQIKSKSTVSDKIYYVNFPLDVSFPFTVSSLPLEGLKNNARATILETNFGPVNKP